MNRFDRLAAAAKEMGMRAIGLTDHGNLFGAIEFYRAAYAADVKPIIGCEVYVAPESLADKSPRPDKYERGFHLTLLAMNADGYRNLVKLSSIGFKDGFYYNPRVDDEALDAHSEGICALSGCLSSEVSKRFLSGDEKRAELVLRKYREIFGRDNFFVELQDHGILAQRELMAFLLRRAQADGIPTVATNDVHYLVQRDAEAHDALLCIGTRSLIRDENRKKYGSDQFYLKSPQEMLQRFSFDPGTLARTVEIADRAELHLVFGKHHLPAFPVPIGEGSEEDYLTKRAHEGLKKRGIDEARYQERLERELKVITQKGFSGYFLIVADFIAEARRRGIPVGPGRGSAAGSLVAWSLEITQIDPIRYGLIFERFLNPERASLPDIDVDICQSRREEVIQYVRQQYGDDRVAQIITFGTFGAKAVLRDVARVHDLTISETERLARLVPDQLKISLKESIEKVADLKEAAAGPHAKLFEIALRLEGLARHASRHAAGVVISNVPMTEVVPLYRDPDEHIITQYDMNAIESLGLLKMDLLGLKTLTLIAEARALAGLAEDDPAARSFDDPDVYAMLAMGHGLGVFQLDSGGIRELMMKIRPASFEDLAALIALYRPGPMSLADEFAMRKNSTRKAGAPSDDDDEHPLLKEILRDTYGIILYQEQVMEIAHRLGGYSLADADNLRKAMGKKLPEKMARERVKFLSGAKKNGLDDELAGSLWDKMERFAGYGFNKSHAVAYAALAYETAWLKRHHPEEFMSSLLSHELDHREKLGVYIEECRRMGIEIGAPHVNRSGVMFRPPRMGEVPRESMDGRSGRPPRMGEVPRESMDGRSGRPPRMGEVPRESMDGRSGRPAEVKKVSFGLAAVKNVGVMACEAIVEARRAGDFKSLWEFLQRVDTKRVNRRAVEALICVGAMDGLGPNRRSMMNGLTMMMDLGVSRRRQADSAQISLFSDGDLAPTEPELDAVDEFDDLAEREMEHVGFYLGEHPILKSFPLACLLHPPPPAEGKPGWLVGRLRTVERVIDKRGRPMARVVLETLEGRSDLVVFSSIFEKVSPLLLPNALLFVRGKYDAGGRILVDDAQAADRVKWTARYELPEGASEKDLMELKSRIEQAPQGPLPVEIVLPRGGKKLRIKVGRGVSPAFAISEKGGSGFISLAP